MAKKVFLPNGIAPAGAEFLTNQGYELIQGTSRDEAVMIKEGQDADAILVGTQPFSASTIEAFPKLKVIARNGVGYDSVDVTAATAAHKYVTITPNALSDSVAETTVTMILTLVKNIYNDSYQMRLGNWDYRKTHQGHDLKGKTIGILGFGRIGRLVASHLAGFGVNFLIYDPQATSTEVGELVSRETLLKESDVVTIHLPLIPETQGSIGKSEFALMKDSAFLINLARGPIVNTTDLVAALKSGALAGAALDVYDEEPLSMDSPLYDLDNVLLTPHIASNTVETRNQMALDAAAEIDRVLSGEEPKWAVNEF